MSILVGYRFDTNRFTGLEGASRTILVITECSKITEFDIVKIKKYSEIFMWCCAVGVLPTCDEDLFAKKNRRRRGVPCGQLCHIIITASSSGGCTYLNDINLPEIKGRAEFEMGDAWKVGPIWGGGVDIMGSTAETGTFISDLLPKIDHTTLLDVRSLSAEFLSNAQAAIP